MSIIQRLILSIMRLMRGMSNDNSPPPYISNQPPEPEKAEIAEKAEKQDRKEHYGTMYYLDDLLDSLDNYFKYMPIFRKHDPETYTLYCKTGGRVFSQKNIKLGMGSLSPAWKDAQHRPSLAFIQIVDRKIGIKTILR